MEKRYFVGIKKSKLTTEERKVKRTLKFIKDVKALNQRGFTVPISPKTMKTRLIAEKELKYLTSKHPKEMRYKRLEIKLVQHPTKEGKTYIFVLRRRK